MSIVAVMAERGVNVGYDVIIVGAGSAGSVLANRLSQDPARRVLLIEAGPPDRNPLIHMPLGLALLARMKAINWGWDTTPQPALNGRRLYWPRGRTLGGSSAINAMIYMRGHPADYAAWAKAAGEAWGWKRARALFLRMERNGALTDAHHGAAGPLSVTDLPTPNPLSRAFLAAGVALGYPLRRDFNGAEQEGVGLYQVTQKNGRRHSAARAFLAPARARANLEIRTETRAHRVLFEGRRAVGVAVEGGTARLAPGGEVILSGGAVNSPQLLMLSGIGPGAALRALGIAVLHDASEVGENLADHLDISVLARTKGRTAIGVAPGFVPRAVRGLWHYARHGSGELTSNVAEAGASCARTQARHGPTCSFTSCPRSCAITVGARRGAMASRCMCAT